jgi:membrane-associated phospholipid phosphatase
MKSNAGLSPEGFLTAYLFIGFILIFTAGLFFEIISHKVFNAPNVVAMDRFGQQVALDHQSYGLTAVMRRVSDLGSPVALSCFSVIVIIILVRRGSHRRLVNFSTTMAGGVLLSILLKHDYHRLRPDFFPPLVRAHGFSFPSGHSMGAMLFFGSMAYIAYFTFEKNHGLRWLAIFACVAWILLIGASRVYLGVHYVSDVLAGYAAGFGWMMVCLTGTELWIRWRDRRRDSNAS